MERLVILCGGYGGLNVLITLLEQRMPDDIQITLIDKNPYHSLKTEFYTIAAGTVADNDIRVNFPTDEHVDYVFGEVNQIDTENQRIHLDKNLDNTIDYDYLVIALGCDDNYHGVDGAPEFTESVQTFSKARHTGLAVRSEEHTSELQSRGHLVCRLLLEK